MRAMLLVLTLVVLPLALAPLAQATASFCVQDACASTPPERTVCTRPPMGGCVTVIDLFENCLAYYWYRDVGPVHAYGGGCSAGVGVDLSATLA